MDRQRGRGRAVSLLIPCSLGWAGVGLGLAYAAPWLGRPSSWMQPPLHLVPPIVSGLFILVCLVAAVRVVGRTGRLTAALPLTLTQVVLFLVLFVQIACHLGASHYDWEGPPAAYDWPWFVAAHAARVGDVVDFIEPFGLKIQPVRHASPLTAACLVAFHLITGVFLLGMAAEWLDRWRRGTVHELRRGVRIIMAVVGVFVLLFMLSMPLQDREFQSTGYLLYLLDNALHTLDFADVMETYHIRLYSPSLPFDGGGYLFLIRLGFAAILGTLLVWGRQTLLMRLLGGWGLSRDELEEIANKHKSQAVRARAARRLDKLAAAAASSGVGDRGWGAFLVGMAVLVVAVAAGLVAMPAAWTWGTAADDLKAMAIDPGHPESRAALETLGRMGPHAASAAPALAATVPGAPPERQRAVLTTLGQLGPAGLEPLEQFLATADAEGALWVVTAARPQRLKGVPLLLKAGGFPGDRVRSECRESLVALGAEVLPVMAEKIGPGNARLCLEVLDDLDPDWLLHPPNSGRWEYRSASEKREALAVVWSPTSSDGALRSALLSLTNSRGAAAFAMPDLVRLLKHPDAGVRFWAIRALASASDVSRMGVQDLAGMILDPEPSVRSEAVNALTGMRPMSREIVQVLLPLVDHPDREVKDAAVACLSQIRPRPPEVVKVLGPVVD